MKVLLVLLLISSQVFAVGEVFWLSKIFSSAKDISDKAKDFSKSVKIAEDLKLIEKEQSKDLKYQSQFMKDVDESNSVMDYIDDQIKVDHGTIETLDALYDASELTEKYFGYSPYEDVYIPYSEATLKTINDALADPSQEVDSQDAHNKMASYQSAKMIIEQAKTNDMIARLVTSEEQNRVLAQEQHSQDIEQNVTRANDNRIFFSKFRRYMR
jgi:hypothetical protein